MDIEKAIGIEETAISKDILEQSEALEIIKTAVNELLQYRQIGTVDECRAAREKQTPKKVRFKTKNSVSLPCCPNCGETYCDCSGGENYCKNCGQKWEWGE